MKRDMEALSAQGLPFFQWHRHDADHAHAVEQVGQPAAGSAGCPHRARGGTLAAGCARRLRKVGIDGADSQPL